MPAQPPRIDISGGEEREGVTYITEESFRIAWSAEGDVQGYDVIIVDENGREITRQSNIPQTEITIRSASMEPGVAYSISVGAVPASGDSEDAVWTAASFMRPAMIATPAPVPEATPVPTAEPEPTPAAIGQPTVNVGGSGYQRDGVQYMTDNTIILSWVAEGDVDGYIIYVENQAGERLSLGNTTDTSRTVSASSLPAGIYTVYIGAVPARGTQEDAQWGTATFGIPENVTPEPEEPETEVTPVPESLDADALEEPEPEDEGEPEDTGDTPEQDESSEQETRFYPIDAETDSETVIALQRQLYRLGVMAGEPEQGVLDRVTLQAVADFQRRANDQHEAGLPVIDPDDPEATVDVQTLEWIARGL